MKNTVTMKKSSQTATDVMKGVSTLDAIKRKLGIILLFLIPAVLNGVVYGGHSILDLVDPTFNPNVQSELYGFKGVHAVQALPDGKILAFGSFTSFNRVPVGKLVRLNADGTLDSTFNNQTITSVENYPFAKIIIRQDGKIILFSRGIVAGGQPPRSMVRLNADGTLDLNFIDRSVSDITVDSLGRIILAGFSIQTPQGIRKIIRLNEDGSLDNSFNFFPNAELSSEVFYVAAQGNRVIIAFRYNNTSTIYRLNEDGSTDNSFTPAITNGINGLIVQPDNKVLYWDNNLIRRLNENSGFDSSFQSPVLISNGPPIVRLAGDGRIVYITPSISIFRRFLSDGTIDPSFNPNTILGYSSFTVQADGGIIIGDQYNLNPNVISINNFVRLMPNGLPDPNFNPGGIGFQNILPGRVQAIEPQSNGKTLLGGKFDLINNVSRKKLARLNVDSTVDTTFQVNTTAGSGNYFSAINDIYQVSTQTDGKIIVSGFFDYVINGVTKKNLVRLNSTGSIDTTFNLTPQIPDYSEIISAGKNRFAVSIDNKLLVGTSKNLNFELSGPLKLTEDGTRDASFNPTINNQSPQMFIDDLVIQSDGKIIIAGSHKANNSSPHVSFVARINTDGSPDSTFPYVEEPNIGESNRLKSRLVLLPNGKIIISKNAHTAGGSARIQRLNSDGSTDNSFNSLLLSDSTAKINALLVLPNGKIFVGGKFTITVNGQTSKNLLQLSTDGNFEPTVYNLNEEVLCLAADSEGRVLVGGGFTVIDAGGNTGANRSYVARLTDSRTQFDFDGDGKADVSVFRASTNIWYRLSSNNSTLLQNNFGSNGDVSTPADFDGDGKCDLAIFRPSTGTFWYLSSISNAQIANQWGQNGDIPRPSDFDGDGKADFVIYRPSELNWYRLGSTGQVSIKNFGSAGDKPVIGDFDGDGKSDVAIYRPSTGTWWYQSSINNAQIATQFGISSDIPSPADFDGDGKTDFAVFRPETGVWYVLNSSTGTPTIVQFGIAEDKPVAADYDGDGKADIAVFRPSTGVWYLLRSTSGFSALQFGISTDVPAENAFIR